MKKSQIVVIFSSHLSDEENKKFKEHVSTTIGYNHEVICYENHNQYSLSEIYNQALRDYHKSNNQIFVFVHNDIIFKTKGWGRTLIRKFNNINKGIIGVAGSTSINETGIWWDDKTKMCGIVNHTDGINEWVSDYGSNFKGLKDVVVVDGLFMGVNPEEIDSKFNENYKGFHYYDVTFCVDNFLDGCDVAVTNEIRITHKSMGMVNQDWWEANKRFIKEYELPIEII